MASDPIVFYPAFSSSYSYFAAHLIDEVAAKHGREVLWRPVRLARVHEHHYPEGRPPRLKARFDYMARDAERVAGLLGLPLRWTEEFPADSDLTAEVCYALGGGDETVIRQAVLAVMAAVFGRGQMMRTMDEIVAGLGGFGAASGAVREAGNQPDAAKRHRAALDEAIASGMFGAPWFVVGDQTFWGHDRMAYLDQWLSNHP